MKVCVYGLWHLGSVTAACLADLPHLSAPDGPVVGLDPDGAVVAGLKEARPPLFEPGLGELIRRGLDAGRLKFTDRVEAVADAELVWVTFDTPVSADDEADVGAVAARIEALFPHLADGAVVLVSSQVPVGFCAGMQAAFDAVANGRRVQFACSPENLRLGRAIEVFRNPERIVVGVRTEAARARIAQLLEPLGRPVHWMRVESAEMTKHAVNAFLATSVAFINEIATLCEATGADAKEVEGALKSEGRIGPKAYLSPGAAFAGGTLARDVAFLMGIGARRGLATPLFAGVKQSNDVHRQWAQRRLGELLGELRGKTVAVLGLTYKPNTDTLRRSESVALCRWLIERGAEVRAHDPSIRADAVGGSPTAGGGRARSPELPPSLILSATIEEAVRGADALVVATEWPAFRELSAERLTAVTSRPLVLDAGRFLAASLGGDPRVRYFAVGVPGVEE